MVLEAARILDLEDLLKRKQKLSPADNASSVAMGRQLSEIPRSSLWMNHSPIWMPS